MLAGQKNWAASALSTVREPNLISFHRIGTQEVNCNLFLSGVILLSLCFWVLLKQFPLEEGHGFPG